MAQMPAEGDAVQMLGEDDVLEFINVAFGIALSREFITKPTAAGVCQLYELFLQDMGVADIGSPDFEAASKSMTTVERHVEWIYKVNVFHAVSGILDKTGFPLQFTLNDLIDPKRKKNVRILNHLIHTWTQVQDLKTAFQENVKEYEDRKTDRQRLLARNDQLKRQIEVKGKIVSQNKAKKAALMEELEKKTKLWEDMKKYAVQVTDQYRSEKQELTAEKEKLSELELEAQRLKEELVEMESQVVRSPDKVKAEMAAKEQLLEEKMSEKRKLTKEYTEATSHLQMMQKDAQDMMPSLEILSNASNDMDVLKEKCSLLDQIDDQIKTMSLKIQQQKTLMKQNNNTISSLREQNKKLTLRQQMRMTPNLNLLADVSEQIKKKEDSLPDVSKQFVLKEKNLQQQIEDTKTERTRFEQKMELAKEVFDRIHVALHEVTNSIKQ